MENLLNDYLTKQSAHRWLLNQNNYENLSINTNLSDAVCSNRNDLQKSEK